MAEVKNIRLEDVILRDLGPTFDASQAGILNNFKDLSVLPSVISAGGIPLALATLAASSSTEPDVVETGDGIIIKPPKGLSEEEKKKLGLDGTPVGGGTTTLKDEDKLPTTTAGDMPEVIDPSPPPFPGTTDQTLKDLIAGGGFTPTDMPDMSIMTMAKPKSKPEIKTGQEYYDDLGGDDDIVQRNVIVNKNTRYNEIYTGKTREDRLDRLAIRYQVSQNKDVKDFIDSVKNTEDSNYDEKVFSKFADLYKQRNPMLVEYLRTALDKDPYRSTRIFNNIRSGAMKLEDYEGGVTQEDIDFYTQANKDTSPQMKNMDVVYKKAENVLRNYKAGNPEATGVELKVNKVGDTNITDLLITDPKLKEHLAGVKSDVPLRKIVNTLKEDGLFEELGFDNYFLASQIKKINSPVIDKYLKENNLESLPKDFDYSSLLNENQKIIVKKVNDRITKIFDEMEIPIIPKSQRGQGFPDVRKQVKDRLRQNLNRMILYQLRDGKNYEDTIKTFKEQTDNPEFYEEVVPLIIKSAQQRNYINGLNKDLGLTELGLDIDNVVLAHSVGVLEDVDLTFRINNMYIGSEKLNQEESTIQRAIQKNKKILNKKNITNEEIVQANEEINNLKAQLESKGYYDSVEFPSPASVSPEQLKQIKRAISEEMFGDPEYYKKGGIVDIFKLTRPINA